MKKHFIFTIVGAAILGACATVPYTNRHQLNLVSPQQEIEMGEQAYVEVLKKNPPSKDQNLQDRLRAIGARIKTAADQPNFKWEFNVVQGKEVNAFCLPGGKVAFYEAIIPICENDNGIAVVMGHEVAHALAHHGAERMSQGMSADIVEQILSEGLSKSDPQVKDGAMKAFGLGTQVGVLLPFSRSHESEADHIGLILMAKAGYDPRGAVEFWKKMKKGNEGKQSQNGLMAYLSTHPSDDTRIKQIESWLPEALKYYKP